MPTSDPATSVVIIGAGPAGCAAALSLAERGRSALLLEKGLPGRDKACGDAWIPSAVQELRSDPVVAHALAPHAVSFSRLDGVCAARRVWSFNLAPFEGLMAPRAAADQVLRDRASALGCDIWHGAEAKSLRISGDKIELTVRRNAETRKLAPSAVILASGGGCRIARNAGLHGQPGLGAAVSAYAPANGSHDAPTFLFDEPSPGYGWVFPVGANESNAGVFAHFDIAKATLRSKMKALLKTLDAASNTRTRGGILPLWSGKAETWSHPAGIIACGDAAGLVDPISGEGLTAALASGRRAGESVAAFLTGNRGALGEYDRWLRDWASTRYAPSLDNRVFAAWVGLAPAERRLLDVLAGLTS